MEGRCSCCGSPCYIECGKCFAVLTRIGEKHNCPDEDDGFFDDDDGSCLLCGECETDDEQTDTM